MSASDFTGDAAATAAAVKAREVSAVELVRSLIDRIRRRDTVNAFTNVFEPEALADAARADRAARDGTADAQPLLGVPVTVKEHLWIRGVECTFGSPAFRGFVAPDDAVVVRRLRDAGAIIVGQTNNSELGTRATTDNDVFGVTVNPWDTGRTCGGSSGGAAAALALGLGALAIGTDQGGSCRIPASFCGVVGFKPSRGLVPRSPGFPDFADTSTLWGVGPLARTVRDVALGFDVMAGPSSLDPSTAGCRPPICLQAVTDANLDGLRIAVSPDLGFAPVERPVCRALEEISQALRDHGADLIESHPSVGPEAMAIINTVALCEVFAAYRSHCDGPVGQRLSDRAAALLAPGAGLGAETYLDAMRQRFAYERAWLEFFDSVDVLITPTMQMTAFELGMDYPTSIDGQHVDPSLEDWVSFCIPANLVGLPAVSVPAGFDDRGLPIGVQVIGSRNRDDVVLRVAAVLEQLRPWAAFWPPGAA